MPIFYWKCTKCTNSERDLVDVRPELPPCPKCGESQDFIDSSSSRIVEVRDNGIMIKQVEQVANVRELMLDRNKKIGEPDLI